MSPGNKNTNSDFEDQGIKTFEDYDMNRSNREKICLVTGATSGIGLAAAPPPLEIDDPPAAAPRS